jgi:hypothetical protein
MAIVAIAVCFHAEGDGTLTQTAFTRGCPTFSDNNNPHSDGRFLAVQNFAFGCSKTWTYLEHFEAHTFIFDHVL